MRIPPPIGLCGAALLLLTACDGAIAPTGLERYADLNDAYGDDFAAFNAMGPTPVADLPSGRVGYDGIFIAASLADIPAQDDPLAMLGDMAVAVDFGGNAITGTASNVVLGDGTPLGGTLVLVGGNIAGDASQSTMEGDISGVLTLPEDGSYSFSNIRVTGAFAGDNGDMLGAGGGADFTFADGVTTVPYEMGFIVSTNN